MTKGLDQTWVKLGLNLTSCRRFGLRLDLLPSNVNAVIKQNFVYRMLFRDIY